MRRPVHLGHLIRRVVRLGEDDYRFGVGPITVRILALLHVQELEDGPWLYVRAMQLRPDGSDRELRQVLIRVAALPKH